MTVMTATNQAHVELTLINVDIGMREFRQFEGKTKSPAAARNQTQDT